jgi:hypothetical protein
MKKSMPYLAIAAPVVIFILLHFLIVDPERRAAASARSKIAAREAQLQAEAAREPKPVVQQASMPAASGEEFGAISDAIAALAGSRAVGGVSNLAVEMSSPRSPVSVSFDAKYPQIEAFVRNLDTLPVLVDISAIQLVPAGAPNMRAKIVFRMFKRHGPPALLDSGLEPARTANGHAGSTSGGTNPSGPRTATAAAAARTLVGREPVVKTILFSSTRRVALVDDRIVKVGDHVDSLVVHDIERDAVVFVNARGARIRVALRKGN